MGHLGHDPAQVAFSLDPTGQLGHPSARCPSAEMEKGLVTSTQQGFTAISRSKSSAEHTVVSVRPLPQRAEKYGPGIHTIKNLEESPPQALLL